MRIPDRLSSNPCTHYSPRTIKHSANKRGHKHPSPTAAHHKGYRPHHRQFTQPEPGRKLLVLIILQTCLVPLCTWNNLHCGCESITLPKVHPSAPGTDTHPRDVTRPTPAWPTLWWLVPGRGRGILIVSESLVIESDAPKTFFTRQSALSGACLTEEVAIPLRVRPSMIQLPEQWNSVPYRRLSSP